MVPLVAIHWTNVDDGVLFASHIGVLYEQKMADPVLMRIGLNIVRPL